MAMVAGHRTFAVQGDPKVEVLKSNNKIGGEFAMMKSPEFLVSRLEKFQKLLGKHQEELAGRTRTAIKVTLPDGKCVDGIAFETTPLSVATGISKGLGQAAIVAKVSYDDPTIGNETLAVADDDEDDDGCHCGATESVQWHLWDMTRPLEGSCSMKILKFDDDEAKHVFWHSSAHVLGQALEAEFGAHLTIGPALERGFYYDCFVGDQNFTQDVYVPIEQQAERIAKENQRFERIVITKSEALELFKDNPFKVSLISAKVPDGAKTTCYRCGTLVDLCRGPHVPSTSFIKAFSVEKHSSAYWLGQSQNDSLQRLYAIAFPDAKQLKEHKRMIEEAKKRDHRLLGNTLQLYFFDSNMSPGSAFWLADGAKIYNKLCNIIRSEYRIRGFDEVLSPNIYSTDLFKVSGHYQNYKENMYMFDVEGKSWGLKPMNCPGHCLMFRHMNPSYRQLPIRMADFGVLHRNELSGSLSGLTRVRRFQQDDAHIFIRMDQIKDEVVDALQFLFYIYELMGFNFELKLSTRPKKAMGDVGLWKEAEERLAESLDSTGKEWSINEGDGAFYGPKIDVRLQDAIKRWHQCGTIQLDFQMPLRFNLSYRSDEVVVNRKMSSDDTAAATENHETNTKHVAVASGTRPNVDDASKDYSWEQELKKGYERPVMVHRAILGSVERMCAVIVEHTAGKFPFWLSPRQAVVCPISEGSNHYGSWVRRTLHNHGYDVALDDSNRTVNKKIREAQLGQWNYILVVGAKEEADLSVTVRMRDDPTNQTQLSMKELLEKFESENHPSSKPLSKVEAYVPKSS